MFYQELLVCYILHKALHFVASIVAGLRPMYTFSRHTFVSVYIFLYHYDEYRSLSLLPIKWRCDSIIMRIEHNHVACSSASTAQKERSWPLSTCRIYRKCSSWRRMMAYGDFRNPIFVMWHIIFLIVHSYERAFVF